MYSTRIFLLQGALTDQGVTVRVCRNAARFRGYKPGDFYDLVTVVPAAMTDLAKWQGQGCVYISGEVVNRTKRAEFREKHPEILDSPVNPRGVLFGLATLDNVAVGG